jgi:GNAT superfamily N-acetyltransferase
MLNTFSPEKNAAFEFCEADYFMAYRDGKPVGRVAAIINHRANDTWKKKEVRFGWIDFIDDVEVSRSLLNTVSAWGKERGMDTLTGPLGFTDMDAEGMLIEGFDQLSTMATIYNYPYYPLHMKQLGMEKVVDWVERKIYVPEEIPEKFRRVSDVVQKKFNLRVRKITNKREIKRSGLAHEIFHLINEAYAPLFSYSKMTERQIDQYVRMYVPVLDMRMVTLIETSESELVGVGVTMPSLSRALQKAHGKLLPFGWFHLLKALFWKRDKIVDLLLVAVKPEYQGKGVNALLFTDLIPIYRQMGIEYGESNPELEINEKVQAQWQYFDTEQHKRRRCYARKID